MQIEVINFCNLRCNFCKPNMAKKTYGKPLEIVEKYKIVHNAFINILKHKTIEFSLNMSETLMYPAKDFDILISELKKLDSEYNFMVYTSLAVNHKKFKEVLEIFKKYNVQLRVSVYGFNRESFLARTNKDKYHLFLKNWYYFINNYHNYVIINRLKNCKELDITKFIDGHELNVIGQDMDYRWKYDIKIGNDNHKIMNYIIIDEDFKWSDPKKFKSINYMPERKGTCKYMHPDENFGMLLNGDISYCAWIDNSRETVLGNISNIVDVINNYKKMIKLQTKNFFSNYCARCGGYEGLVDETFIDFRS